VGKKPVSKFAFGVRNPAALRRGDPAMQRVPDVVGDAPGGVHHRPIRDGGGALHVEFI
jgi:hypothetical protein